MEQPRAQLLLFAMKGWAWPILSFLLIFLLAAPFFPDFPSDSEQYRNIAQGLIAGVPKPFSNRVFLPLVARNVAALFGLQTETSFSIIAIAVYTALLVALLAVARRLQIDGRVLAIAWFLPLLGFEFAAVYLPDLLSMFWIMLILWAIAAQRPWLAALLFFPAIMTRESLAVLGAVLTLFYLSKRHVLLGASITASVATGFWMAAKLSARSMGNVEHMNQIVYLLLKFPFNSISHLIGVGFWTNAAVKLCDKPAFVWPVPGFLQLGNINEIGICPFDGVALISGWFPYLSVFGIGAGVLLALLSRLGRDAWRDIPMAVQLALVYGVLMFVIGPMSGASLMRLTMYGWPAFLVALPYLSVQLLSADRQVLCCMAGLQLISAWVALPAISPFPLHFVKLDQFSSLPIDLLAFGMGFAANVIAFVVCTRELDRRNDLKVG